MTPKELAFLVAGGIIGAAIYKRLGVLAWWAARSLITTLGLAPVLAPLAQTCP